MINDAPSAVHMLKICSNCPATADPEKTDRFPVSFIPLGLTSRQAITSSFSQWAGFPLLLLPIPGTEQRELSDVPVYLSIGEFKQIDKYAPFFTDLFHYFVDLTPRQQGSILIAALTANGDLEKLRTDVNC
jgi:hypothetical protein